MYRWKIFCPAETDSGVEELAITSRCQDDCVFNSVQRTAKHWSSESESICGSTFDNTISTFPAGKELKLIKEESRNTELLTDSLFGMIDRNEYSDGF